MVFEYGLPFVLLIVSIVVLVIIVAVILLVVFLFRRNKKELKPAQKNCDNFSYKQQMYYKYRHGDKDTPYYASNKISKTTYNAFADYIFEFFGYEKGSAQNNKVIQSFVGKFDVLPDYDKNITWPRTTTYRLTNNIKFNTCLKLDNDKVVVLFHHSNNELYRKLKLYFNKRGIEIKNPPRIKPFAQNINEYVVLDASSEECTFIHYLLRLYYKERSMFGLKHNVLPEKANFNNFKSNCMWKYKLADDYEFNRYLLSFFFDGSITTNVIMGLNTPDIESIRYYINKWPGYNKIVWDKCKFINKELNKELK